MGKLAHLKKALEARRLNALHNTTAGGIRAADKLGGIPAPSHAVVPEGQPFDSFGDISLIAKRETVDPQRGHKLFEADVYSRRQPRPLYRVNKKISSPEAQSVRKAMDEFDDSSKWEFSDWVGRGDPGEIRNSAGVMVAYARANGIEIPTPTNRLSRNEYQNKARELQLLRREMDVKMDDAIKGVDDSDAQIAALRKVEDEYLDRIAALDDELLSHTPISEYDIRKKIEEAGLDPYQAQVWLADSLQNSGDWSSPYFLRGKKKIDYTADNLADFMNARTRGEEQTLVEGLGKQRAKNARQFKTIDQARAKSGEIVSDEAFSEFKDYTNEKLFALADRVDSKYSSQFQKLDDLSAAIGDVMGGMSPEQALRRHDLSGNIGEEMKSFADEIRNGPTEYFEGKFQGVAKLADYAGAVVPDGTPEDVIQTLKNSGLQVETYTDSATRASARAKIPGTSFVVPIAAGGAILASPDDAEAAPLGEFSEAQSTLTPGQTFTNKRKATNPYWDALKGVGETALTIGSAIGGGTVADLSRIGGYLNPLMPLDRTEEGAQAIERNFEYRPSDSAEPFLESLGRQFQQFEKDMSPLTEGAENSIPMELMNALPERLQRLLKTAFGFVL